MKKVLIGVAVVAILGVGLYFLINALGGGGEVTPQETVPAGNEGNVPAGGTEPEQPANKAETIIGKSAGGRDIMAYHFGTGTKELLFVTGIHGGYAWNTVLLGYEITDYLKENPNEIPANIKVTVIPVLNPDGLFKVVGVAGRFDKTDVSSLQSVQVSGRFNANTVDINRNFDCDWKASGIWQEKTVSGGSKPFSEPESVAIRDYVKDHKPTAVVAWYSAAGGVFSSSCNGEILPETQTITNTYSKASGYPAYKDFNYYELSGDMTNWFAKNGTPAISILLTTHEDIEWNKNVAGIKSLFEYYAE